MNGIEGCNIPITRTSHPHLVAGPSLHWDDAWQIHVYDEGHWVVGIIRSDGLYYRLTLNGDIPTWPKAIATQICDQLAKDGAYLDDARDREANHNNHETRSLDAAFTQFQAWRGRSDDDYAANGSQS